VAEEEEEEEGSGEEEEERSLQALSLRNNNKTIQEIYPLVELCVCVALMAQCATIHNISFRCCQKINHVRDSCVDCVSDQYEMSRRWKSAFSVPCQRKLLDRMESFGD
jgi:hypothetical protein